MRGVLCAHTTTIDPGRYADELAKEIEADNANDAKEIKAKRARQRKVRHPLGDEEDDEEEDDEEYLFSEVARGEETVAEASADAFTDAGVNAVMRRKA